MGKGYWVFDVGPMYIDLGLSNGNGFPGNLQRSPGSQRQCPVAYRFQYLRRPVLMEPEVPFARARKKDNGPDRDMTSLAGGPAQ